MALYTSHCKKCDTYIEYVRKIADRNNTPICCDEQTEKIMDAPMVGAMKIATGGVFDSERGIWLEGAKDVDKHYKATGTIPVEEASQEAKMQKDRKNKAYRKTMRETIAKRVYQDS